MHEKRRYKLYKAGKRWLIAALVIGLVAPLGASPVVSTVYAEAAGVARAVIIKKPLTFVDYFTGKTVGQAKTNTPSGSAYVVTPPSGYALAPGEPETLLPEDETSQTIQVYSMAKTFSKWVTYKAGSKVVDTRKLTGAPFTEQNALAPTHYETVDDFPPIQFLNDDPVTVPVQGRFYSFKVQLVDAQGNVVNETRHAGRYDSEFDATTLINAVGYHLADGAKATFMVKDEDTYQVAVLPVATVYHRRLEYWYKGTLLASHSISGEAGTKYDRAEYLPEYHALTDENTQIGYFTNDGTDVIAVDRAVITRKIRFVSMEPDSIVLGEKTISRKYNTRVTVSVPSDLAWHYWPQNNDDLSVVMDGKDTVTIRLRPLPIAVLRTIVLRLYENGVFLSEKVLTGVPNRTEMQFAWHLPAGMNLAQNQAPTLFVNENRTIRLNVQRDVVDLRIRYVLADGRKVGEDILSGLAGEERKLQLPAGYRLGNGQTSIVILEDGERSVIVETDTGEKPEPEVPDPEPETPAPDPDPDPEPETPAPDPDPDPEPEVPDPEPEKPTPPIVTPPVTPDPEPEKPLPPIVTPPVTPDPDPEPPTIAPPVVLPPVEDGLTLRPARQVVAVKQSAVLYKDKATSQPTGRVLKRDTRWQAYREVLDKAGQVVAYHLGGEQFVKASEAVVVDMTRGVFTVRHPAKPKWAIATWTTSVRPVQIIKAGSRWQTFGKQQLNDGHWYHDVGGGQYVRAEHGTWRMK
ncbi:KxYKxGKxW signal peptide domain-containing protein [Schleiferilactobacillus shenzhenensis]|uniref:S-layer protein C-terminal domain-containing protein n=1 Tax=Schleiferilactobacillus shenzhenensis LY-73 TaxID=1231336 RepID=U4TMS6_9LACO|nr:KxYKxGKxW signal peptide domain-containing protein [Schleiferilactobacillus shenzhenensis]ERL64730.1 hypothetical protein L248_0649 [Schleiferilactobacillus shenzhenensis LY-73]